MQQNPPQDSLPNRRKIAVAYHDIRHGMRDLRHAMRDIQHAVRDLEQEGIDIEVDEKAMRDAVVAEFRRNPSDVPDAESEQVPEEDPETGVWMEVYQPNPVLGGTGVALASTALLGGLGGFWLWQRKKAKEAAQKEETEKAQAAEQVNATPPSSLVPKQIPSKNPSSPSSGTANGLMLRQDLQQLQANPVARLKTPLLQTHQLQTHHSLSVTQPVLLDALRKPRQVSARAVLDDLKTEAPTFFRPDKPKHTIQIHTWQDVEDLTQIMDLVLLHSLSPKAEGGKEIADFLRRFFLRHHFEVAYGSEVFEDQMIVLRHFADSAGRKVEDMAWATGPDGWQGNWWDSNRPVEETVGYVRHLGCLPRFYPSVTEQTLLKAPAVLQDGLLLIYEHAIAKLANNLAMMMADPRLSEQIAKGITQKLLSGAVPLVTAGIKAALAVAGIGAAVPMVGWIAAALAAAVAVVMALFDHIGAVNRREEVNLEWQSRLQRIVEDTWVNGFGRPPLVKSLLGYQLGVLDPDPSFDAKESRARAPWLRNLCLNREGMHFLDPCAERIYPQIPFFVRHLPRAQVVQFGAGKDELRTIFGMKGWLSGRKVSMGWRVIGLDFEKLAANAEWLGIIGREATT